MVNLTLSNVEQILLQVKVDLIGSNEGNLTIMDIQPSVDVNLLEKTGIDIKQLPSTLQTLKSFAQERNFILRRVDQDSSIVTLFEDIETLAITTSQVDVPFLVPEEEFSLVLEAEGGNGPYIFSLEEGSSLPLGLSLSESGIISGTAGELAVSVEDIQFNVTDVFGVTSFAILDINTES
jgi:hypothetical protein